MNIGEKIRNARLNAGLTQEQAAEALCVSRQTISNWENGKTYPDIVSVVKMSDLYNISLDCLLKEGQKVSDYVDYLDESTNTVKSKKRLSAVIVSAVYLSLWAVAILVFWLFMDAADAMGYSFAVLWIMLPALSFIVSFIVARDKLFGKARWAAPVVLGVMYMLAEYATFSAANMISFGKINAPAFEMIAVVAAISLLGMLTGMAAAEISRRASQKKKA